MTDFEHSAREYTRPPMTRGVNPQRMNWLWQLILQATDLKLADVRAALIASGVPITDARIGSWQASDRADNYFPLTIAELERNLRAVVAAKKQAQHVGDASDTTKPAGPAVEAAASLPAGSADPQD